VHALTLDGTSYYRFILVYELVNIFSSRYDRSIRTWHPFRRVNITLIQINATTDADALLDPHPQLNIIQYLKSGYFDSYRTYRSIVVVAVVFNTQNRSTVDFFDLFQTLDTLLYYRVRLRANKKREYLAPGAGTSTGYSNSNSKKPKISTTRILFLTSRCIPKTSSNRQFT
jgi:hypothetical protein